ncbi:hypothetical protein BD311DRAFT_755364 [Dichomitus squalens]|uniref:Uncharacterized protein n=1 Tax=Dichomitus squalens TaxID=114155 RepID=A0A4Q9MQX0_9APHY|nr:hypothetical protein BD311DRAFT_755364 [Dichomitus squalens]
MLRVLIVTAGRPARLIDPLHLVLRAGLSLVNCVGLSQSEILRINLTVTTNPTQACRTRTRPKHAVTLCSSQERSRAALKSIVAFRW